MAVSLSVLIVEDSESDARLIVRLLKKAGYELIWQQVETAAQMRLALDQQTWQVVISDYNLPQFDGRAALEILKEQQEDIPFIVVSGAIGEESAVALMKAGAHDYLTKGNLNRLAPVVERELEQVKERRKLKQAEQALRESEARYRAVAHSANEAIISADSFGNIAGWNHGAEKIFGYTEAEVMNQPLTILIPARYHEGHQAGMARINSGAEPHVIGKTVEMEGQRKDGRIFPLELSLSKWQVASAQFYSAIIRDITERKQAEEAMREIEYFNQTLLNNSPIGISVRSRTGQLLSANQAWKKIWAIPEPLLQEDFTRERESLNFDERDNYLAAYRQKVRRIYEQGGHLHLPELKIPHPRPTGAEWISQHFYAIQDTLGQVARVVVLTEDITERKQAHEVVRESEERLTAVMDGSQLGYSDWNIQSGEIRRNERWANMLGYTLKEIENTYQQWEDLIHPDDRAAVLQSIQDHIHGKTPIHRDEYRLRTKDGNYRWILDQGKVIEYDLQGRPLRMTATHTDVTERVEAGNQLRQLSRAVEQSPVSIMITDMNGNIEYVNPKFTALNGFTLAEVRGRTPRVLKSGRIPQELYEELWQTILSGQEWRGELLNRKKNGNLYWEYATISAITDSKGRITHFVAVNEDITIRKESEEKVKLLNVELEQQAVTDFLTNLYNRRYFMQRGAEELERSARNKQSLALLMLDIDEFKKVNDSYGHEAGDAALQQVARALKADLRETDILGRMGGEEFAVLLSNTTMEEAALLAERIRQTVERTAFDVSGKTLKITICIGIAVYTDGMSSIDDLLRNADTALYHAKYNGRNRVLKFTNFSNEVSHSSSK